MEVLLCLVVAITDGDTLRARCDDRPAMAVRLAEIDAPEKKQPYGEASSRNLAAICLHKQARIEPKSRDRNGRTVARVFCEGVDANAEQVRAGMAWVYTKYLTDPSMKDLEAEAKGRRQGIWSDPAPVAPWDWRHKR